MQEWILQHWLPQVECRRGEEGSLCFSLRLPKMFSLWSWICIAILIFYKSIHMKKNDTQDHCLTVTSVNPLSVFAEVRSPIGVWERCHEYALLKLKDRRFSFYFPLLCKIGQCFEVKFKRSKQMQISIPLWAHFEKRIILLQKWICMKYDRSSGRF